MSYFDNFSSTGNKDNIFNKGNAGEAKVTMQAKVIAPGALGPKGNPLPANLKYTVTFTDANNPSARPVDFTVREIAPNQQGELKAGSVNAALTTAKYFFLAVGGNLADLPNPGNEVNAENANKVLFAMMDYVVSKTQSPVTGRGFFHYCQNNKPNGYLNYRDGFKCGFVTDSTYVFETSDSQFMVRPPMANSTTDASTTAAVADDLPF
jgi:hypothetical protein